MTIKSINYLALSPDQRKRGAAKQRENLRNILTSPLLTDDQRQVVRDRLEHVRKWEQGELDIEIMPGEEVPEEVLKAIQAKKDLAETKKAGPSAKGKNHEVKIKEKVPVKDDVN